MLVTIKSATTIKTAIVVTAAPTHWQQYLKRLKKPKMNSGYFKCALRSSSVSQVAVLAELPKNGRSQDILYSTVCTSCTSLLSQLY